MEPLTPRTVLDAIADAQALWTYRSGTLAYDDRLSALDDATTQLERALSRLQVLTTTHPDLTLAGAIPPGAVPDDELREWLANAAFLRDLVETPEQPATITITVTPPPTADELLTDVLRVLNGMTLTTHVCPGPDGTPQHRIDLTTAVQAAIDLVGPVDEYDSPDRYSADQDPRDTDPDDDPADTLTAAERLRRLLERRGQ